MVIRKMNRPPSARNTLINLIIKYLISFGSDLICAADLAACSRNSKSKFD